MSNIPILGQKPSPKNTDPTLMPIASILLSMEMNRSSLVQMPMRKSNGELVGFAAVARGPMAIEVQTALLRMLEYLRGSAAFQKADEEFVSRRIQEVPALDDKKLKGVKED